MAETPRAPIYTVIIWPTGHVARIEVAPARPLISSGATPPAVPVEWPNPRRAIVLPAPVMLRRAGIPAAVESTLPFATLNWPNPQRWVYQPESRSWLGILAYLGIDTFYGGPGQVPPHEWVNPLRARQPVDSLSWSQSIVGYIPLPPPPGAAMQTLPDRGARPSHAGYVQGSTITQPVYVPPAPTTGFWLIRFRRRLDDDEEGIWA